MLLIDKEKVMENSYEAEDKVSDTNQAVSDELESAPKSFDEDALEEAGQIGKLEEDLANLKDTNLRLVAEMQNTQKRALEESKKARDYAISNFAKEVVTIRDYLEMALKDQSGDFEMLKMGVDLTLQQLIKVFENHQIKEINPQVKDKLDANLHQAMSVVEEHEQEPNTIVSVMQKGYLLNGRVLRAAMVTVAK